MGEQRDIHTPKRDAANGASVHNPRRDAVNGASVLFLDGRAARHSPQPSIPITRPNASMYSGVVPQQPPTIVAPAAISFGTPVARCSADRGYLPSPSGVPAFGRT